MASINGSPISVKPAALDADAEFPGADVAVEAPEARLKAVWCRANDGQFAGCLVIDGRSSVEGMIVDQWLRQ